MIELEIEYSQPIESLLYSFYIEKQMSAYKIAQLFRVSKPSILKWLKFVGVPIRSTSENSILIWNNPEYKEKISQSIKKSHANPEFRQKQSQKSKELWEDVEYKRKQAKAIKEKWDNVDLKNKISYSVKSYYQENPEACMRMSEIMKHHWQNNQFQEKMSQIRKIGTKKLWRNTEYRQKVISAVKQYWSHDEHRQTRSHEMKKLWSNSQYAQKCLSCRRQLPNKLEIYFDNITPKCVHYVGDGKFGKWLPTLKRYKYPDFIIVDAKNHFNNKVIELFGSHPWHTKEEVNELIEAFAYINIECLIFWDYEIYQNTESVLKKIAKFINQSTWQLNLF